MSNKFTLTARIFTAVLITAAAVCAVCNFCISGELTWSWYTTASLALVLFVGFAFFIPQKRRIAHSLAALTVLIFPYLALLSYLTGVRGVILLGFPTAGISLVYLWLVYALFAKMKKETTAAALSCIAAVPLVVAVNLVVAGVLSLPVQPMHCWSVWDSIAAAVLLVSAFILFTK